MPNCENKHPRASHVDGNVEAAGAALKAYQGIMGRGEPVEMIKELLADLMHYADAFEVDFNDALTSAKAFHAADVSAARTVPESVRLPL